MNLRSSSQQPPGVDQMRSSPVVNRTHEVKRSSLTFSFFQKTKSGTTSVSLCGSSLIVNFSSESFDYQQISGKIKREDSDSKLKFMGRIISQTLFFVLIAIVNIGAGGSGFDFRIDQIVHSIANGLPPLRCFFKAVLARR